MILLAASARSSVLLLCPNFGLLDRIMPEWFDMTVKKIRYNINFICVNCDICSHSFNFFFKLFNLPVVSIVAVISDRPLEAGPTTVETDAGGGGGRMAGRGG